MELAPQLNYPDSVDSSPHSLTTDSWDEPNNSFHLPPSAKIRLMCSYGGRIVPRPHDKSLCYLGGHTRIISFDRNTTSLSSLSSTLSSSLLQNRPFSLKYQLPNEDLDSLISVATDEDLDNMIEEYDRLSASVPSGMVAHKPSRIRLFVFPSKPDAISAPSSIGSDSKSDSWFVDALNGGDVAVSRGMSADVNSLLGLDVSGDVDPKVAGKNGAAMPDVQSLPSSPLVENASSSFGSGSSVPSVSRFGADDGGSRLPDTTTVGVEEQFARMGITVGCGDRQDEDFLSHSAYSAMPKGAAAVSVLKDEKGEQVSSPVAAKNLKSPPESPIQSQQIQITVDYPPDAVARDSDPAGAVSRPKPLFYQDSAVAVAVQDRVVANPVSGVSGRDFMNPNYQIPVQVQDMGFTLQPQHEQQQQPQQQQQQQQQFFHAAGPHYVHHHATGQPVPIPSYYQVHLMQQNPQQQQQQLQRIDQQYSMYYMPVGQTQAYSQAFQANLGDTHVISSGKPAGTLPNPMMVPASSIYPARSGPPQRTVADSSPQLINVSDHQYQHHQQYMGYHQLHNLQPTSHSAAANFPYEFTDLSSIPQMQYAQLKDSAMALQYQTMNSAATTIPENSQLLEAKQNRTPQPL